MLVTDESYPRKCHYSKRACQDPECGSGRFCAGTYKGDAPPPPPGGITDGVAEVETAIPALTDSGTTDALTCGPSSCDPPCVHPAACGHRYHEGCTCLGLPGGAEESGAGNTMMSMNSGIKSDTYDVSRIISCFKRVAEYYPGLHRDDGPTVPCPFTHGDAPQTGTKPEHMKYT